jgi:hypothetical protein
MTGSCPLLLLLPLLLVSLLLLPLLLVLLLPASSRLSPC